MILFVLPVVQIVGRIIIKLYVCVYMQQVACITCVVTLCDLFYNFSVHHYYVGHLHH
jgi:hypothetical protein